MQNAVVRHVVEERAVGRTREEIAEQTGLSVDRIEEISQLGKVRSEPVIVTSLRRENARLANANAELLGRNASLLNRNAELERVHQRIWDEIHELRAIVGRLVAQVDARNRES